MIPDRVVPLAHRQRMGKNFVIRDRVRFHHTSDAELDGFGGYVIGKSIDDGVLAHYIVMLDNPHSRGDLAVSMPEVCLEFDEIELVAG